MGTKGKNLAPEMRETSELNIDPSASEPGTFFEFGISTLLSHRWAMPTSSYINGIYSIYGF
jgi:hypothetical protein